MEWRPVQGVFLAFGLCELEIRHQRVWIKLDGWMNGWMFIPEKALAALTGHGVEMKAGGFVTTNATDPGHVPVELILGHSGRTHNRGLHYWEKKKHEKKKMKSEKSFYANSYMKISENAWIRLPTCNILKEFEPIFFSSIALDSKIVSLVTSYRVTVNPKHHVRHVFPRVSIPTKQRPFPSGHISQYPQEVKSNKWEPYESSGKTLVPLQNAGTGLPLITQCSEYLFHLTALWEAGRKKACHHKASILINKQSLFFSQSFLSNSFICFHCRVKAKQMMEGEGGEGY